MINEIDQKILGLLIADSRILQKELAARVGLSAPAVAERVRKARGARGHFVALPLM